MSANADFVRGWIAAWNGGEVEALIEVAGPEFEWVVAREHPDATTHRGVEAVSAYLREWLEMMPDLHIEIVELEEAGDRVLSVLRLTGTGTGSGATTDVLTSTISTFRDGVPVRTEEFLDPGEARRALREAR